MGAFRTFWRALAFADRKGVYAMLERWLADADAELAGTGLTDEETGFLRRFRGGRRRRTQPAPARRRRTHGVGRAEFSKYAPPRNASCSKHS